MHLDNYFCDTHSLYYHMKYHTEGLLRIALTLQWKVSQAGIHQSEPKQSSQVRSSWWFFHTICYGTASCLISSHLINHASPILSNELSNTSVWLLWNSSLFNLLYFIIVWSCGHYYKVWQLLGITPHYWLNTKPLLHTAYTQTLSLFSQTIFLLAISLYVLSFTHYLLIFLSSYLLISDSPDSRIISYWRISGLYLIG